MRVLHTPLAALLLPLLLSFGAMAHADADLDRTPPVVRLSLAQGEVTFWRPGAEDWTVARVNTPLAAGDTLHIGADAAIELQIDDDAFVRAAAGTRLDLLALESEALRLRVENGRVAFDLTRWHPGFMLEVESPDGVFQIERAGYYRMEVNGDTRLIVRDGGYARVTTAAGERLDVYAAESLRVATRDGTRALVSGAPAPDYWDAWNQARTDDLTRADSARHLPPGVGGARELDRYGTWRDERDYGPVWVPRDVPPGWAPYSSGGWIRDPYYEWAWVDDAPWGWAPFHYGRWVYLEGVRGDGYWAWAPGPRLTHLRRTPYSPALVGFYGTAPGLSIHLGVNTPGLSWVALSWGEPLIPWWHRHHAFGQPWWGGWHGPRVVNQVLIQQTTVVDIRHIRHHNKRVANAVVSLPRERFGQRKARPERLASDWAPSLEPLRGALPTRGAVARGPSPAPTMRFAPPPARPDARLRADDRGGQDERSRRDGQMRQDERVRFDARMGRDVPMGRDVSMGRDVPMQRDLHVRREIPPQPSVVPASRPLVEPARRPSIKPAPQPSIKPAPPAGPQAREPGPRDRAANMPRNQEAGAQRRGSPELGERGGQDRREAGVAAGRASPLASRPRDREAR